MHWHGLPPSWLAAIIGCNASQLVPASFAPVFGANPIPFTPAGSGSPAGLGRRHQATPFGRGMPGLAAVSRNCLGLGGRTNEGSAADALVVPTAFPVRIHAPTEFQHEPPSSWLVTPLTRLRVEAVGSKIVCRSLASALRAEFPHRLEPDILETKRALSRARYQGIGCSRTFLSAYSEEKPFIQA